MCNCIMVLIDNFAIEVLRLVLHNSTTFAHWAFVSHGYLGIVKIFFAVLAPVFDYLSLFWLFRNNKVKPRFDVFTTGFDIVHREVAAKTLLFQHSQPVIIKALNTLLPFFFNSSSQNSLFFCSFDY